MSETSETFLNSETRLVSTESMQAVTTDSVLLAAFAAERLDHKRRTVCDLFCGSGLISLLLARRCGNLTLLGVDIDAEACELYAKNAKINGLDARMRAICADATSPDAMQLDAVVANPPYFSPENGAVSPDSARNLARQGCSAQCFAKAAAKLLKNGGALFCVYPTARLIDLTAALREANLEPKRMRLIAHCLGKKPSLVLVEAVKGAHAGLDFEPTLYLYDENGEMTAACAAAYALP